jgi:probable rRNA maturation factor
MSVEVRTRGLRRSPVRAGDVRRRAERMLRALRLGKAELSILLCDDDTIRELNRTWRRKDRPTDVLAFAMHEGEGGKIRPELLGDVVISLETARRQAVRGGRSIAREVSFLLAHGLLHLLGSDHRTRAEERVMNARTDALVAVAIGAGRAGRDRVRSP